METLMRMTKIGAGFVGLVPGASFADFGHYVSCVDTNPAKIAALNCGEKRFLCRSR